LQLNLKTIGITSDYFVGGAGLSKVTFQSNTFEGTFSTMVMM
jgi:hypothetical protein